MKQTIIEKFNARISPEPMSGCWLWTGLINSSGYGWIKINDIKKYGKHGTYKLAHRISYELFKGVIPEGLEIDHLCRVRSCVNPDHLEAVTHVENCYRTPRKSHCKQGHPLDEKNTLLANYHGWNIRRCKTCLKLRMRIYRSKRKIHAA